MAPPPRQRKRRVVRVTQPRASESDWNHPSFKPSVGLYIKYHLKNVRSPDYGYRMWKTFSEELKMTRDWIKPPSWNSFKNYIFWLKKAGLLVEGERRTPDVGVEQKADSPVSQVVLPPRMYYQFYELPPAAAEDTIIRDRVRDGTISDEVLRTFYYNPATKRHEQLSPAALVWNDPRHYLYARSYELHRPKMMQSRKRPKKKVARYMSFKDLNAERRKIENEMLRRGYRIRVREPTREEIEEAGVPARVVARKKKEMERARLRTLRGLSTLTSEKDVAVHEVKRLAMDAILVQGRIEPGDRWDRTIMAIRERYGLNVPETGMAIDSGSSEAFMISNEPDRDKIYEYVKNLVRDAVAIPIVDLRAKKVIPREVDVVTMSIIKSLTDLHRLSREEVDRRIQEGRAEGWAMVEKWGRFAEQEVKEKVAPPAEEETEEESEEHGE